MINKLPRFVYSYLVVLTIVLFSSCYSYGPIHEPYERKKITPPPPITKRVGTPLTKSEYMQKTYNDIKNTLNEAEVKLVEDSIKVLFPSNIVYEKNALLPISQYESPLAKFSELLKKYYKTEILVSGHTDNTGDKTKNKEISRLRAKNIVSILIQNGIKNNRLESMGLGDLLPIATNDTDEGRNLNRRVEFVVLYRD